MNAARLPVAVIGAGPVGLAAAAHLLARGKTPLVLEAGPAIGHAVRQWEHVRMFTPWRFCVDRAAASPLALPETGVCNAGPTPRATCCASQLTPRDVLTTEPAL